MTDYHWALQTALFSAISGVAGGRVYDAPPQEVSFPHVVIDGGQSIPDDTSGGDDGMSEFFDLHVWSRYRGWKEAKQIVSAIYDALHGTSLTVTGRTSALAWVRTTRPLRDPDGISRQIVVTIEIIHRT